MDFDPTFTTANSQETARIGQELGDCVRESGIRVVCLYGELGSGKTTFAQGFARGLGITTRLLSPTFIIVRRYPMSHDPGFLYHIDLYRVAGEKDLIGLGLPEILSDPDSVVLVEWAEKLGSLLPKWRIDIRFTILPDDTHQMAIAKLT